jgi:hypothetical protein
MKGPKMMEEASGGGGACGGMLSGHGADDNANSRNWCEILAMHTRYVSKMLKVDEAQFNLVEGRNHCN